MSIIEYILLYLFMYFIGLRLFLVLFFVVYNVPVAYLKRCQFQSKIPHFFHLKIPQLM